MITNFKGHAKTSNGYIIRSLALVMALIIACASTAFAATTESYTVDIYDGSEVTRVETSKTDAKDVVAEANISITDNDKLILNDFIAGTQSKITICRESNVKFTDANGVTTNYLFAGRVSEFYEQQGIVLSNTLVSGVDVNKICYDGIEIFVLNSYNVTVNVDGESIVANSTSANVSALLTELGITLGADDEVTPALDTALSQDLTVEVLRVTYSTHEETESVPFAKKTQYSSSMQKGSTKVTQAGKDGTKNVVYKDKIVNGAVASTVVETEQQIVAPIPQITTVGTRTSGNSRVIKNSAPISELTMPSKYTLNENGIPTSYKKVITGKAAAYCVPGGKTATGKPVKPGYIAVNPKQIPYGTEMYIVSDDGVVYGYAIAADTGGFANKGKFVVDLYMNSTSQCYSWGARNVTIYVLG